MRLKLIPKRKYYTILSGIFLIFFIIISCKKAQKPYVIMIAFDGLSIEVIDDLTEKGELPAFKNIRNEGATLLINSFGQMLSPVVWTTVITGKMPEKHGIDDFITQHSPSGKISFNVYSHNRKTKALWNIVPDNNDGAAVVNWWGTYPCEHIVGIIVSKQFIESYTMNNNSTDNSVFPNENKKTYMQIIDHIKDSVQKESMTADFSYPGEITPHFTKDQSVFHIFQNIHKNSNYRFIAAYFWQLDQIQHIYYYAYDREFDERSIPERGRKIRDKYDERIITDYYKYYDSILQRIINMIDDNTILFIVSDHGFGMIDTGIPWHLQETYGFVYSRKDFIKRGFILKDVEMTDFAPTVLHILGYPVGRDMDGRVLTEIFSPGRIADDIRYIDSYDNGFLVEKQDFINPIEEEQLERLRTLGYIN